MEQVERERCGGNRAVAYSESWVRFARAAIVADGIWRMVVVGAGFGRKLALTLFFGVPGCGARPWSFVGAAKFCGELLAGVTSAGAERCVCARAGMGSRRTPSRNSRPSLRQFLATAENCSRCHFTVRWEPIVMGVFRRMQAPETEVSSRVAGRRSGSPVGSSHADFGNRPQDRSRFDITAVHAMSIGIEGEMFELPEGGGLSGGRVPFCRMD